MLRPAADVGKCSLRRLLHHVAQLPGQRQLTFAIQHLHFGRENAATHLGPRQPSHQAHFAGFVNLRVAELGHSQKFVHVVVGYFFLVLGAVADHPARHLAAHIPNFALQVAHPCLARITANDIHQRCVAEDRILFA